MHGTPSDSKQTGQFEQSVDTAMSREQGKLEYRFSLRPTLHCPLRTSCSHVLVYCVLSVTMCRVRILIGGIGVRDPNLGFPPNYHKEVKRVMTTGSNRIDVTKCKRGMRAGYAGTVQGLQG